MGTMKRFIAGLNRVCLFCVGFTGFCLMGADGAVDGIWLLNLIGLAMFAGPVLFVIWKHKRKVV